jgi:uncharacterized protein (TIGR02246 family)
MKYIILILMTGLVIISSAAFGQVKGEMPFSTSSIEAKKLLRNAWVAYADAKFDEANGFVSQALKLDSEFGMAHAFIYTADEAERAQHLKKALSCKLSTDEKLFIDGLLVKSPATTADFFEPLLTKYPKDDFLNFWIMFNYHDLKSSTKIGEMIVKRNQKFAPAYNMLGYHYMAQGNLKDAETNFNKYLSLRPDLANAYDSKGDYFMRVGKTEDAIAAFEKAAGMGLAQSKGRADMAKAKSKYRGPSSDDVKQIKNVIASSSEAYLKADVDGILEHYSDQAIELFPNQMINAGAANIRQRLEETFPWGAFVKLDRTIQSVQGAGPIAVAWAKTDIQFKPTSGGDIHEDKRDDIFLLRKQPNGQWKILAHHWYTGKEEIGGSPSKDSAAVREVLNKWSFVIKPGEILSQQHVEKLAAIHSAQGVEIYPNQRSNIGMANMRARWDGFAGIKWAQFTDIAFEVNSFAMIGPEGSARKAVAWGIGDHTFYPEGSTELAKYLFPWAMILTKEKDDQWRILVYHFYTE